ncbi:MAG TPA: hypothetical protein VH165_10630 [Kofleriaceae bacterium]|jgi:chromosome segregation ATPase|nr:hypothetical protein [Kofleriaceae bacterium]
MNKPTGDEPSSEYLSQQASRREELFTIDAVAFDAKRSRTAMLERMLVTQHRRAAAREAAHEGEIAKLQSEVAKLQAANQHLQKENDSLREEVLHHRHAVGHYEEENAELRDRLEMPKVISRLSYN